MKSAFILQHAYELDGCEEIKFIGVYTSSEEAQKTVERLRAQPGFKNYPDDFHITEYEFNKDHWTGGFSTLITIMVKDTNGNWHPTTAAREPDNTCQIIEKYEDDSLWEFKDGDIVRCELLDNELRAVEKVGAGEQA
ncbi:hypothetical protein [Chitinophaga pinensis]|uniref:DUF7336 domain-containing protein n=1 Tax=Chitinophaga pinensis TaxID=79329 RepID=UPI001644807B|nr:hypothetical protein [Chitinophaga pinensis]